MVRRTGPLRLLGKIMTIETKTTIQCSDIATIEFECKECHSRIIQPLKIAQKPPTSCQCRHDQEWIPHGGKTYQDIVRLIGLVQDFAESNGERFTIHLGLKNS
jgi:hypothetical protein